MLRKSQDKLNRISRQKNARKRGSKAGRKLAKREGRQHQKIARARKDFPYKTAHKLVRTGKKVFFHEDLNLKGLTKRNAPKQDETGAYLPNGQSAKSGLNLSWADAAFGRQLLHLGSPQVEQLPFNSSKYKGHIAGKAGAVVMSKNPAYTSQLLSYRDEVIFTDCGIREYWDYDIKLWVDRRNTNQQNCQPISCKSKIIWL